MKKCYVVDTNVLLHDPSAIQKLCKNKIIIPIYVLEEIDNFKKEQSDLGRNARQISRYLDILRQKGDLGSGVSLEQGGILSIKSIQNDIPKILDKNGHGADNKILTVALEEFNYGEHKVVLVSKDINMRLKASAVGLEAEDYENDKLDFDSDELYTGTAEQIVAPSFIDNLFKNKKAEIPGDYEENSFITLTDGCQKSALVRVFKEKEIIKLIRGQGAWGITGRNKEQNFAFDLLLDDSINLVTLIGQAGTGKTLISLSAGLEKVLEKRQYLKLLVSRPIFPLGKDIGFLPGMIEEKMRPWMQPIYDNLEVLFSVSDEDKRKGKGVDDHFGMSLIKVEPLTYIRGRSIPKQFLLVDEAQNTTKHELKTILTRAGEDTKIILTGDPSQIDNPYLDSTNNGLVHVVSSFKGQKCFGHVTLTKGERSPLAELASKLL